MSLTGCIQKAGTALRAEDKEAILAAARVYRAQGMSPDDAGRQAIRDQIEVVKALLAGLGKTPEGGSSTTPKPPGGPGTPAGDAPKPPPAPPKPVPEFAVGDSVLYKPGRGVEPLPATVTARDGTKYTIELAQGGTQTVEAEFLRPGPKAKPPKAEPKPADSMADLIEGSDAPAIAEKVYEGIRAAEPEDFPVVLADDRLIRMPVLVGEREKVEARLKALRFRITDRSQESADAARLVVSAIYRPDTGTIGDAGEKMGGGRKDQNPPPPLPKDASDKSLDEFLAALHPKLHTDPDANPEQSFGAMMLKEAMFENIEMPTAYLSGVMRNQDVGLQYTRADRDVLKKALAKDTLRARLETLSKEYVERLKLLQTILTPANRVADVVAAFKARYTVTNEYGRTTLTPLEGKQLKLISDADPLAYILSMESKFEPTQDTTDQTHRVKKKDADAPPRLERIVRIGMKDHRNGRDVVSDPEDPAKDDFMKTFGFRGLEFGNWVTQAERQANLNLAYDSLMDLADLTGLAPKTLGMLGRMGFAIGSRGRNPKAAAHFEPDNNVINLTKTKGNGTVGHEWFHGFDHNSARVQPTSDGLRASEARKAVTALAEALVTFRTPELADSYLRSILRDASSDSNRNVPPKQAVLDAVRSNPRYRYMVPNAYSTHSVGKTTGFYSDAQAMDRGADKKYWSTPVEMLARAFETFLYERSKGGSPYLVGPSRADGAMTPANGYGGTPYPRGEERKYIAKVVEEFVALFDPETLTLRSYKPVYKITEVKGLGWVALDQHGVAVAGNADGRMDAFKTEAEARQAVEAAGDTAFLNAERAEVGKLNLHHVEFLNNIDKIMEEMGLERWPEIKNGSMSESMFFHLRQGWWPANNQALKEYAAKAHNIKPSEVDLLKLKGAQEDFEAALARFSAQRVTDMRNGGADSRAIYDYLVGLYQKQPNLDVRTGTSQANQAYSTPLPISFVAGLMGHVTGTKTVFDATGGNGMLLVTANPKKVVTIEMEPRRAQNLRLMEYGRVIEGDATKKIATDVRPQEADTLLFNPPFGALAQSVAVPSWDGREFMMGKIDQLIAAQGMKAMADRGHAVIILGAHKNAGTITSTDRVFLNWLYSNYNVADHFEVDGALYARQGANWPLRVLVVAGRKETVGAFPTNLSIDRVNDFDQLWSRSDEARKRAEQVVVGAGVKPSEAGGADQSAGGVSGSGQGQDAGAGGKGGAAQGGSGDGDVADGKPGSGSGADGKPGTTGGATAGDGKRGGDGASGLPGDVGAGRSDGGDGSRRGAGGTAPGGLSDLDDDDIDSLIEQALGGKTKREPKAGDAPAGGTPAGDAPEGKKTRKGEKAKPGKSILDDIPGLEGLLGELGDALNDGQKPDEPPEPPKDKKKRETAQERRERLKAHADAKAVHMELMAGQAHAAIKPPITLEDIWRIEHSNRQIARAIQAALDWQTEQENNPTAPLEKVSSRAMFSRNMAEDQQYGKVQPVLAAIWKHLSAAISDIAQRIKTLVVGATQKFGNAITPFVKRFLAETRNAEQDKLPDGKKPIRAEAVDNEAQVVYRGRSSGDSSGIFVPRNQATALERSFDAFEAEYGEVDQFVQKELGYDSIEDMHKGPKRGPSQGLAGYQVDALALALGSMKRGDGFIIGDDTGVGKGRTAAALIAWAVKNDKVPIFFSYKSDLYSAMYDDMTDIGMESVVKPMPTDADAVIKSRQGKLILKNNDRDAKRNLNHIIDNGTMPGGNNALFSTYFQVNTPNLRREAIKRLVRDGKAVLIMDEAHNSAGDSGTNKFFMSLLTGQGMFGGNEKDGFEPPPEDWIAPPTVYLTATYAKRPSNMPVYIRTQLRHAANSPGELVDLFGSGGDVLQQIASEMLVSSGSMIRRERSYAGVKFEYVVDEENAPRDARAVDQATAVLRQIVYADRAFGAWVKSQDGQQAVGTLVPPGFEAIAAGTGADVAINKSEFTSVVHNYVGQLLLATKVRKAVEMTVAAINSGQKPVLTLQNTMEAALSDYVATEKVSEGDPLPGFGWKNILKRGITSARRVTFDAGTGNKADKVRVIVPTALMPAAIQAEFTRAEAMIADFESDLPGSPIDALRSELGKYRVVETADADGVVSYQVTKTPPEGAKSRPLVAVEVTGREFGVDYSAPVPTYMRREDPDNLAIIRGFQGGSRADRPGASRPAPIDVVILNSSGSTGISLHASEMAIDQRPRHMIVLQPNPDIAVFKQTTGRIHRTGQVEWPFFSVLATGIPAERRALAMLKKKIGSLFSNTSSGEGTTNVDAVDFINQYGDAITAQYLEDNQDVADFINISIPSEPAGSDIARKASGRAALLSVDEQRDYFDTIEQQFLLEIEQRNATGTNALARRALDLQAAPTEMVVLEEGMDESNPFTASAYLTKYMVNVIGDIPTAEKVRESISATLNGRTPQQVVDALVASLATKFDEAKNQLILRRTELDTSLADPEATEQEKTALKARREALEVIIKGFSARREQTIAQLTRNYGIGYGVSELKVGDVEASAVIVGVSAGKSTSKVGNPFSPSNIIIHFQRNVPGGRLSVPLSKMENAEYEARGWTRSPNIEDWFGLRNVSGGRKERYIASGNLLRARTLLQGGEIALHTLEGSTEQTPMVQGGIIMPQAYVFAGQTKADFTIRYQGAALDYILAMRVHYAEKRFERTGIESYNDTATDAKAMMRFPVPLTDDVYAAIAGDRGGVLKGPGAGWSLRISPYDGTLMLAVGKDFPRIIRSKEIKQWLDGGDFAKRRGDTYSNAKVKSTAEAVKGVLRVLANNSPMIAPDTAADVVRELSRQHFQADNSSKPALSRGEGERRSGGQTVEAVQALAQAIAAKWVNPPRVVVVPTIDDPRVPAAIRKEAQSLKSSAEAGRPDGFYDQDTGAVYLIAGELPGAADVVRVLFHESLGHFGLRAAYGDKLGDILDRMSTLNADKVRSTAKKLGLDFADPAERRMAAEEVLAYMAQSTPEIGWVRRAVAAIRSWLRDNIPGLGDMALSDAEIIRDYILPARRFVEDGTPPPGGGRRGSSSTTTSKPAFSRSLGDAFSAGLNNTRDWKLPAGYAVGDLLDRSGRLGWWHKTVGTMYHLAQRSAPFKRVYDSVQTFLGDVSYYAAEAADLAPSILPKLESWRDIGKSPLSPADTKALSAPIFEGTLSWGRDDQGKARPIDEITAEMGATSTDDKAHKLMRAGLIAPNVLRMWQGLPIDQYEAIINGKFEREFLKPGVVFTDKELREHFGLNDRQISHYREFRAATDKSIDNLAISEMLRYAGADADFIRDPVLRAGSVMEAAEMLRDQLIETAKTDKARNDVLLDTANKMIDIADHAEDMKARGYAPLSRFGTYTLEATLETGERYFSLFESSSERSRMARTLARAGATNITSGTMSQEDYKLLNGVSPETVALFGDMLGLQSQGDEASDIAFQQFIKRGVANRSAMKRLLHRQGIAGFSEDAGRVLAGFVYSNGRRTSSNLHTSELTRAVSDIPKQQGELKDAAVKLKEYVSNPQEEAQAFRGLLFAQYLGGSVASAMVNATQPIAVTLPYLSQFGGIGKAAKRMAAAMNDATKGQTGDARLDEALRHAEEAGIVSPQEVHALQAQASGRAQLRSGDGTMVGNAAATANNALSKLSLAWGKVFGVAEQFNRRITFIAAFRTAVEQGISDPAGFAEKAVAETQFTYNKGNKPRWARGAVGSILFTFKQYSVNYVELLTRMSLAGEPGSEERRAGQKAALLALAVLFLMAGADGLPFSEDLHDVIDAALQRLGHNISSKQAVREFLASQLGKDGADFVLKGASGIPGVPIDVSGRLGMGNLIPGTGLLLKKADHSRDLLEFAGAAGDMVKRTAVAAEQLVGGKVVEAATTISPVAARNVVKAIDMADTGMYRDDRGRKVIDTTGGEALAKAIGFQPRSVARIQEASFEAQRQKSGYIMASSEIREKWARAIFEGDKDGIQAARDDLARWNRNNPDQPMTANMPAILARVKEMRKTKEQRMADTAPKAIRDQVRAQLKEATS